MQYPEPTPRAESQDTACERQTQKPRYMPKSIATLKKGQPETQTSTAVGTTAKEVDPRKQAHAASEDSKSHMQAASREEQQLESEAAAGEEQHHEKASMTRGEGFQLVSDDDLLHASDKVIYTFQCQKSTSKAKGGDHRIHNKPA